jgi:phosphoglycerate dehydrogenase-like enzyme
MTAQPLTIFVNQKFPDLDAEDLLARSARDAGHTLVRAQHATTSNLTAGAPDPAIHTADVAFGQPDPAALLESPRLKWVALTTAGYDRYDREDLRAAFARNGTALTTSSSVYDEPCAQHAVAMLLAQARGLHWAFANQRADRGWPAPAIRRHSRLLTGQNVLILSFGAIARRVVQLLQPFDLNLIAVRRRPTGDEPIKVVPESEVDTYLPEADHVLNILPGGAATKHFIGPDRLARMKPGAVLYNIGRGTTVDQDALVQSLQSEHLGAAWLDVTDPEPLPPEHPLWTAPNCHITPHTAGGSDDEFRRLVAHFLDNLDRFTTGKRLRNRVV